jgi:hypothetical protein
MVEESAKTAAIAVAPARAYRLLVVIIMTKPTARPDRSRTIIGSPGARSAKVSSVLSRCN